MRDNPTPRLKFYFKSVVVQRGTCGYMRGYSSVSGVLFKRECVIYLCLPEGLSIRRYVQVLPLNMVCFIAIKKMNTKNGYYAPSLLYSLLTLLSSASVWALCQGLWIYMENILVQAGRLRRPKIVIEVFVFLAGANAPAKNTHTSRKGEAAAAPQRVRAYCPHCLKSLLAQLRLVGCGGQRGRERA